MAFVQGSSVVALAGSSSVNVSLTGVTAGNSIIVYTAFYGTPGPPTASVTGYTQAVRASVTPASTECSAFAIHYLHNVSSGSHNISVSTDEAPADSFGWAYAEEVSNLVNAAPNVTVTNSGTSNSPSTGNSSATTAANCYIAAGMAVGQSVLGTNAGIDVPATSGYTNRFVKQDVLAEMGGSGDSKQVSSTGVQSAAWGTLSASAGWAAALAAFEETAEGGPSNTVVVGTPQRNRRSSGRFL